VQQRSGWRNSSIAAMSARVTAVLGVLAFVGVGAPAAQAAPAFRVPSPCVVGACQASVTYTAAPGESARVEIDWDHAGPAADSFVADRTLLCAAAGSSDAIYASSPTSSSAGCMAQSPIYGTVGATQIVLRVTPNGGAPSLVTRLVQVVAAKGRQNPRNPARGTGPCGPPRPGEQCGPGNGRKTGGGGAKVSHAGWPAITGILWKVLDSARHAKTGGPANDELLGHHGSEVIHGGAGRDVIWGDWDPASNGRRQIDRLFGEAGDDWIYSSHGRNTIRGGTGKDYVFAYYGRGTIDCGPGFDTVRVRVGAPYRVRNCERVKNFCSFGSKPGNRGGCYKPGERPARKHRP